VHNKYRVLVVEDSAFMRKFITDLLHLDHKLEVVGTAINGIDAIEKVKVLKPDVITLDIEMPEMDGLRALAVIMKENPTPVVMLSTMTKAGADATVKALELGAVDFIAKPSGNISLDLGIIKDELLLKVKTAAKSYHRVVRINSTDDRTAYIADSEKMEILSGLDIPRISVPMRKIIAIGSSTGGPRALHTILSNLPGNIPAGILIVQHMPFGFTKSLAERLNSISQLTVSEAKEGDELLAGTALLAPGDKHMKIVRVGERFFIRLSDEPPIGGLRPSIDIMMESLAECQFPVVGVILTGMGHDGVKGLKKIKEINGFTIAQDESTCVIYGMPRSAVENNCVDRVTPLYWVPKEIMDNL
jgi:two-component system chemotaxis response regulator CheB